MSSELPLKDRVTLVTGASRGIGRSAALALAKAGAHVLAAARTVGALEELDDEIRSFGGACSLVPADLSDYDAIDRLGGVVYERWGRLDALAACAGVLGELAPTGHIAPKTWDKALALNLTANWRLIRAFDPLLKASPAGRALFVTCSAAQRQPAYWGCAAATKAGLEALVATYATESEKGAMGVNLMDPGPVRTRLRAQAMPGEDPSTLTDPDELGPLFVEMLGPDYAENSARVDFRSWRTANERIS